MLTLSSMVASDDATSDDKVGIMMTMSLGVMRQ